MKKKEKREGREEGRGKKEGKTSLQQPRMSHSSQARWPLKLSQESNWYWLYFSYIFEIIK